MDVLSKGLELPPEWTRDAACRNVPDPDLFFRPQKADVAASKEFCARCPVRAECLAWALETKADDGVWGGTDPKERRALRRQAKVA